MELSEKILLARQEAGLSQRQLAGEQITRNMLSQIEHGTARPSMQTLRYLANRLGKPVSYFLDGEAEPIPASQVLEGLTVLQKAEKALAQGQYPYARELLDFLDTPFPEILRQKLLLLGQIPGVDPGQVCAQLPSLDGELYLRARGALAAGDHSRALHLLEAMEGKDTPDWHLLMGRIRLQQRDYRGAAQQFHRAEEAYPRETAPFLEVCYRELEDFKRAYEYACKQKSDLLRK